MGALTENRKRCFAHLLPSSPHPISDLTATPASKKAKFQLPPPRAPAPPPASFPPPARLPRRFHGPERVIRVFNLGSSNSRSLVRRELPPKMGNFVSSIFFNQKREESLELDDYRKLVSDSAPKKVEPDLGSRPGLGAVEEISPSSPHLDSREVKVLNRRVEDARRVVEESIEVQDRKVWLKRDPVYTQLYEAAKKRDSRLSSLAFQLQLTEEKVLGYRSARKALEEKPQEELDELFRPLSNEEEDEVSLAFYGGNRRQLLVTHKISNIEITREVLQCLDGNTWLNDEVINLYLELLKERERREPKKFLKCHFFNTFFYKKLISGRSGYDFNAVRRWTTQRKLGYSLFECDKIFIPIHKDIHWCLAVIDVKNERFQYLDSLGGMDTRIISVLARYLMDEVKDKSNREVDTTSWKQEVVDNLPLQQNGWDCGMFMLKYTDFYSRGLGLCFSQERMTYFRKRTALEILRLRAE